MELFCLFVACSYMSMEITVLSCHFSWVWSGMPKVLWNNKLPISLERVEWFCACSYLHLVRYALKLKKYAILTGIFRHMISANQIGRCFKLKRLENYMRYQVNFLLPLKLQKIPCCFGLWLQITLGQSVCRIFYFWLVWLVKLNTGGPLLHCTWFSQYYLSYFCKFKKRIPAATRGTEIKEARAWCARATVITSTLSPTGNRPTVALWCSGYHYCTTSFNKTWTQVLCRFKSCSRRVGDLR